MRRIQKINDQMLLRAMSLGSDWHPVSNVGISPTEWRVLFYFGILFIGTILSLPTILFGLDPLLALKLLFDHFGMLTTLLTIAFVLLIIMPLVHEALHIVFHPDIGRSHSTVIGGNFFALFVIFDGPMSKYRMSMYLLAPLIGILILLFGGFVLAPQFWPVLLVFLANHMAMCQGDLLLLYKLWRARSSFNEVWNCGTVLMGR